MSTDDHIKDGEDRNALVAEYVLGLLSSGEHERVGRLIENDQSLRAERDFWVSRFAALNEEYEETPVPGHIYAAIEARAFGDVVKARPTASFWESLMVWRSIAAGALAVAVAAVGFNLMQPASDVSSLTTQLVAALEEEGSAVKFVALYDGSGNVRLTALSGDAVPNKDFELWAIQGGNNPISMGVIPVDQRSAVEISPDVMAGWGEGSVLAITLEEAGGSPDGNPHGPIVAKGAVTRI
ncbi:anti-sigma factor [Devosia sp. BSSL-BM10]|uniref:Anti-sigma factor n=1 Tax=Devosia litorisediminis TaxID=2829817 RepID=A0A942E806_9HYPH|nr:anti-sigma factor [Devosia litorisediminis]MBS3849755.1 anti-sigma factor [Devosia litorisediminis]